MMAKDFDPGEPDGSNASLKSAISTDGSPQADVTYEIPARCGVAARIKKGQILHVINTPGTQVCDFWAFSAADVDEYMSMEHIHTDLDSIYPKVGDNLVSNRRRPIMKIVADTSPGVHDTVIAACDHHRYQQLGCVEYHDNCVDNLRMALIAIGLRAPAVPSPFNIWMNTPVAQDGSFQWLPTISEAGDTISFLASMDCIAVMSACPQDLRPINGEDGKPSALNFRVENPKG